MKIIYTYKNHIHVYGDLYVVRLKENLMYIYIHVTLHILYTYTHMCVYIYTGIINMHMLRPSPILIPGFSLHPAGPHQTEVKGNQPVRKNQRLTNKA